MEEKKAAIFVKEKEMLEKLRNLPFFSFHLYDEDEVEEKLNSTAFLVFIDPPFRKALPLAEKAKEKNIPFFSIYTRREEELLYPAFFADDFSLAEEMIENLYTGLFLPALTSMDISDLRATLNQIELGVILKGKAEGESRAKKLAELLLNSNISRECIEKCKGIIGIIKGGNLALHEALIMWGEITSHVPPEGYAVFASLVEENGGIEAILLCGGERETFEGFHPYGRRNK